MFGFVVATFAGLSAVFAESCAHDTGGSCLVLGCNSWRHAECHSGKCLCSAGSCAVNGQYQEGECVVQDAKGKLACPRATPGTCFVFGCPSWRKSTCVEHQCVCSQDECAVNGECIPSSPCPRSTHTSCSDAEPCAPWRNATCINGECMCSSDTCGLEGQCVGTGNCPYSLNIPCGRDNCVKWTGASCQQGFCMCDSETQCANNSVCLPKPRTIPPRPTLGTAQRPGHRALVLSGGGAKGAFELGVLLGICNRPERANLRGWDLILGTSIGALSAGLLAQYPKEFQCSRAVEQLQAYWGSIKSAEDIWMGSNMPNMLRWNPAQRPVCLTTYDVATWWSNMHAFNAHGGLCDPSPGAHSVEFEVNATAIRTSGVRLRVPAVSITTGQVRWWTEASDNVVEGTLASGSLSPVVFPKLIEGPDGEPPEHYIDGGFYSNTPITKALMEGATDVLVIILDPVARPRLGDFDNITGEFGFKGLSIIKFEFELMQYLYFTGRELSGACDKRRWPNVTIHGYVPDAVIGGTVDFANESLVRMQTLGLEITRGKPVDLCTLYDMERHEGQPPVVDLDEDDGSLGVNFAAAQAVDKADIDAAWLSIVACACCSIGFMGRAILVSRRRKVVGL